jgi:hypothetical protein
MLTTTQAQTKIPTTMEGMPFMTSAVKRTTVAERVVPASAR